MITNHSVEFNETCSGRAVSSLRAKLAGELVVPGSLHYETARRVWNGAIDRHPAVIVRCSGANDVRRAIEFACQNDLEIAVRYVILTRGVGES